MMYLLILVVIAGAVFAFMQQEKFGSIAIGEAVKNAPNFKKGKFMNESHTPDLAEGVTYYKVMKEFFFNGNKRKKPSAPLPSIKTSLHAITPAEDVFIWFGHSSYFIQVDGKKILVDPVFSGAASPLPASVKSFAGTDIYSADDIPEIDFLLVSHDHWDHLDHATIKTLKPKIQTVICGLDTGAHFERWGFAKDSIIELGWNTHLDLKNGFSLNTVPARHFSGRGFIRNKSLWLAYALQTPSKKLFIGGDSGYDEHFKRAGEAFGPFDLAILECGQYDLSWKYIHMLPHEVLQAANDLKAQKIIPVHWGKFQLANHDWDAPIKELLALNNAKHINICSPMIGQKVLLHGEQVFEPWWERVK